MQHQIVSRDEWVAARKAHLAREKEFTRQRDALSAERRALPWVRVDKDYVFQGGSGRQTLADLFGANSQLVIYHFMFGPENVTTREAQVDARVGGGFRVVMLENTGERHEVSGTYYEVVANERLMFSWCWITTPERVSSVTVTFKPDGDGTILTLLHEKLFDEQAVKGHTHGWTGSLVKLEELFA